MKGLRKLSWLAVICALFYGCAAEIDEAKLEESGEIDSEIADHASNPSAHHTKTTDASEIITGVFDSTRIPDLDASNINYDNAISQLVATKVQEALDELAARTSCPSEMVEMGDYCIDKYEGSISSGTLGPGNGNNTTAVAQSIVGVTPQGNITWFQAAQACANAGKKLCTNQEWQIAAAGTPDDMANCNISAGGLVPTGTFGGGTCISKWGVYDMVGNLREWVGDWAMNAGDNGTSNSAPSNWETDYGNDRLSNVGSYARHVTASEDPLYWSHRPAGVMRGGNWGSDTDAGVFCLALSDAPSYSNQYMGFRCCKNR